MPAARYLYVQPGRAKPDGGGELLQKPYSADQVSRMLRKVLRRGPILNGEAGG